MPQFLVLSFSLTVCCIVCVVVSCIGMPSLIRESGTPDCPNCGLNKLSPVTEKMLAVWGDYRGRTWDFCGKNSSPWWFLCLPCHKAEYNDGRTRNGSSKPRVAIVSGKEGFHLTSAPPELKGSAQDESAGGFPLIW